MTSQSFKSCIWYPNEIYWFFRPSNKRQCAVERMLKTIILPFLAEVHIGHVRLEKYGKNIFIGANNKVGLGYFLPQDIF